MYKVYITRICCQ